jgi:hypothetical protein
MVPATVNFGQNISFNKRLMLRRLSVTQFPQKSSRANIFCGFLLQHIFVVAGIAM